MATQHQHQWNKQPVLQSLDLHAGRQKRFASDLESTAETLGDVATFFAQGEGGAGELAQLRACVLQLAQAHHRSRQYAAALEEMRGSYEATGEPTDFEALLEHRTQQLAAAQPFSAAGNPVMQDFDATAANQGRVEEAEEDEQIDDDVAIAGGQRQLAPNANCPLSQKPVLELQEPVQDRQGFVYEKRDVVAFFRSLAPHRHGRAVLVAGTTFEVTLAELVPADKVIKEQKRQQRRQRLVGPGQQAHVGGDDVLEV